MNKHLNIIFLCLLAQVSTELLAQKRVTIFYDSAWAINSRDQASYYRNAFMDSTYRFLVGPIQDRYADGTLAMKGLYQAGKKQGEFSFYYPNGAVKVRGKFVNNLPVGTWRFFYENGQAWQTLEFLIDDYKVLSYHDKSGVQKVSRGSGRFEGNIYSYALGDTLYVDGLVEAGLKDGIWVYYDDDGNIVYEEKYTNGQFRYTLMYTKNGQVQGRYKKPVGYTLVLPFELMHTERFVYAPDVKQSDYPYLDFLPDEDTLYFDQKWKVIDKELAVYYRPTNEINRTNPTGYLRDYYMNGQLYREGRFLKGSKSGQFRYYHPNGQLSALGNFSMDQKVGSWKTFYENGSPQDVVIYRDGIAVVEKHWDKEGVLVLRQGTGSYTTQTVEIGNNIRIQGQYVDYRKQGTWKGFTQDNRLYFEEEYDDGRLIRGISYDDAGHSYNYVQEYILPYPEKGMQHFYDFVGERVDYPHEALINNTQGKVLIELVIDATGQVTNSRAIQSPNALLSQSAEKITRRYNGWQPGKIRGRYVASSLILPITFSLKNMVPNVLIDEPQRFVDASF